MLVDTLNENLNNLIRDCSDFISDRNNMAGQNVGPFAPAVFVFMGKTGQARFADTVRSTLDQGWVSFSSFIEYLKYDNTVTFDKVAKDVEVSVNRERQVKDIFKKFDPRINVFIDSSDPDIEIYMKELFRKEKKITHECTGSSMIAIYLMVDEMSHSSRKVAFQYIREVLDLKRAHKISAGVVLSNVLYNNSVLGDESLQENYRLAANLAYISNTYDVNNGGMEGLNSVSRKMSSDIYGSDGRDSIITAGYLHYEKPVEPIARTVLNALITRNINNAKGVLEGEKRSHIDFKQKYLEKDLFGLEKLYEEIYRDVIKPQANKGAPQNIYQFLPDSPDLRTNKKTLTNSDEVRCLLSPQAKAVVSAIEDFYVKDVLHEYMEEHKLAYKQNLMKSLQSKISYVELYAFCQNESELNALKKDIQNMSARPEHVVEGAGNWSGTILWAEAVKHGEKQFFDSMKPVCIQVLDEYLKMIEQFFELERDVCTGINQGQIESTIRSFYSDKVAKISENDFRNLFSEIYTDIEAFCKHLQDVFVQFSKENSLNISLWRELLTRLQAEDATVTMRNLLGFKNQMGRMIESCRLNYGKSPEGKLYCLVYKGADGSFVEELRKELQNGEGEDPEELFESSLQDMVERIMICRIDCNTTYFDEYNEE